MKGLLKKDFIAMKSNFIVIFLFIIIYDFIGSKSGNISILYGLVGVFSITTVTTSMSLDEMCHWDKFSLTLPVRKKTLVIEKFILSYTALIILSLFTFICSLYATNDTVINCALQTLTIFTIANIMMSVSLSITFKYGTSKARILFTIFAVITVLLVMVVGAISLIMPSFISLVINPVYILISVILANFLISYLAINITIKLFDKREF